MSVTNFGKASAVYKAAELPAMSIESVVDRDIESFSLQISQLVRSLGDQCEEDFLKPVVAPLRRLRFRIASAPLNAVGDEALADVNVGEIERRLSSCSRIFPSVGECSASIWNSLSTLMQKPRNPLMERLNAIRGALPTRCGLLVPAGHLMDATSKLLQAGAPEGCETITALDVRDVRTFDHIVIFGARGWYPAHVFTAPRASTFTLIRFSWIRDSWPEQVQLPRLPSYEYRYQILGSPTSEVGNGAADFSEIAPKFDWKSFLTSFSRSASVADCDPVDAKAFSLEGDSIVLLGASDKSSASIVDFSEPPGSQLRRSRVGELEPGVFLVFYESGGRSCITEIADEMMGADGSKAKSVQAKWKENFRKYVKANGSEATATTLTIRSEEPVTRNMVDRWAQSDTIRPLSFTHFSAVLSLIGEKDKAEEWWKMLGGIQRAHQEAGVALRSHVLASLEGKDVRAQCRSGLIRLKPMDGGGFVTLVRITGIAPEIVKVPPGRIGELLGR